jgi:hypothetical protein
VAFLLLAESGCRVQVVGSATIDNLNQLSQDDDAPIDLADFEEFFLRSCRERVEAAKKEQPTQVLCLLLCSRFGYHEFPHSSFSSFVCFLECARC